MSGWDWAQVAFVAAVTAVFAPLGGRYLAAVFGPGKAPGDRFLLPVEGGLYRLLGIDPEGEQRWTGYTLSVLVFGLVSILVLYVILRFQGHLPFDPTHAPGMDPELAFNTAASFITGTNWQAYSGETQASYLSQMAGLVVAQFTAAAVGLAVALAVIRGIAGQKRTVGNFWVDLTKGLTRVFLPLSLIATLVMVSQGAVQNFDGFRAAHTITEQTQQIPGGPVSSMEAIKLLGTNGGSFYAAGGAHPFENPNGFTNMFDLLLVIVLPFAIVFMFGRLVGRRRQGYVIAAVMVIILFGHTVVGMQAEAHGNHLISPTVAQAVTTRNVGGNMEGKEVRFGAAGSALMTGGTMGTTAGATDSALDSYTPVGGASALVAIVLSEISPGGDGGGLYGILMMVLLAVFVAGLMVGRTPELLGKKIGPTQMKMVVLYSLAIPTVVLTLSGISLVLAGPSTAATNPGLHGFTEIVYAFSSVTNNNGSAFGGLIATSAYYQTTLGLAMILGRFVPIILAMAVAGSLAGARVHARTRATLDTTGPTFGAFLLGVIIIVGGLIYLPMFILGPIGERLIT